MHFTSAMHNGLYDNSKQLLMTLPDVKTLLNLQKTEDITNIAKYLREIEKNMKNLKMIR